MRDALRLSPHVTFHARGEAAFAWHGLTGEVAEMSRDVVALLFAFRVPEDPSSVARRRPGGLSRDDATSFARILSTRGFLVPDGRDEQRVALARYPVVSPHAVWFTRDDGGLDVYDRFGRAHPIGPETAAILARCDGHRTLAEALAGGDPEPLFALARPTLAVVKLLAVPAIPAPPPSAASTMPWPELADPEAYAAGAAPPRDPHDLRRYHEEAIDDAELQFEEIETTLSHLFRDPHPSLDGRTFGEALADGLRERGALASCGGREPVVVETGGGLGWVGASMRRRWQLAAWHTVELSPALARAQRAKGLRPIRGDARRLPIRSESVDVLVSNEMAGDLGTEGAVNVGALELVRELGRVLRPGGLAWVSEFGAPDEPPRRSDHLDHDEWSLRFRDLEREAKRAGLEAELVPVTAVVGLSGEAPALVTTRASFAALRGLFARHGVVLDKRAWTRPVLEESCRGKLALERIRGLTFRPMGERTMGLVPGEFWALVARRPA
jgi:SAM-dependent methyltransferase